MGYTGIYEFGGINTWEGEIVTGEETTEKEDSGMRMMIGVPDWLVPVHR